MTGREGSSEAPGSTGSELDGGARKLFEDLALILLAGLILVVPAWLRSTPPGRLRLESGVVAPVRIEINRAPWYEWTLLEGIGEARARRIVEYRDLHGPFPSIEDLGKVPRMPAGWVEKARPHLAAGR